MVVEPKWKLDLAIETILASGVTPTDLSHELGFKDTAMVYRYKHGKTKSTTATRAKIIYDTYNMLLADYTSAEQLEELAEKEQQRSVKTADACGHIFDKLLLVASYKGKDLRQKLLKFISDYDTRN